ncbi:MAG: hypothetical protein WCL49_09910 [bacterium]
MNTLSDWMARALVAEGAVVETVEPEGLDALLSASLQNAFRCGEFQRLGFGASMPENARRVTLESDWVESLGRRIETRGRRTEIGFDISVGKAPDATEVLRKALVFDNATYRFTEMKTAVASYRLMVFRVVAVSDEKREDVLAVTVNEGNAARADGMAAVLLEGGAEAWSLLPNGTGTDLPAPWLPERIRDVFGPASRVLARERLSPFLAGMERRMGRDLDRLHAYHEDLRKEALRRQVEGRGRKGVKGDASLVTQRLTAIEREYEAKVADVRRKYGLTIEIKPLQTFLIRLPVHRLAFVILRRKGERTGYLDWNPITRKLDALGCEACGAVSPIHSVCDDKLHVVCSGCYGACQVCRKSYCRACHPKGCPHSHV